MSIERKGDVFTVCERIEKMPGGYVVYLRWPYGGKGGGAGPVICKDFDELVLKLRAAALEETP